MATTTTQQKWENLATLIKAKAEHKRKFSKGIIIRNWSGIIGGGITRSIKYQIENIISRKFMHKKWWINDPDVVLLSSKLSYEKFIKQFEIISKSGTYFIPRLKLFGSSGTDGLLQTGFPSTTFFEKGIFRSVVT
jgi:hypothetical protein